MKEKRKKMKKGVDKKRKMWYYCKALERDRAMRSQKDKAKTVELRAKRTLKIKQRRDKKEPDKIQKSFICTRIQEIQSSNCELVFERAKVLEMIRTFLRE